MKLVLRSCPSPIFNGKLKNTYVGIFIHGSFVRGDVSDCEGDSRAVEEKGESERESGPTWLIHDGCQRGVFHRAQSLNSR